MALKRRRFTREFTWQVVREVEAGKSPAQAAREYQVHPTLLVRWRKEPLQYAEHAFTGNGRLSKEGGPDRRAGTHDRPADDGECCVKKSLVTARSPRSGAGQPWRELMLKLVATVQESADALPVMRICQTLSLGRAAYYRWRAAGPRPDPDVELRGHMQQIAVEMPAYGYRRITHELQRLASGGRWRRG